MRKRIKLNDACGAVAGRPAMSANRWAVLLAGGDGIRLQELTRRISGDSRPKQFCRLIAGRSLFEQTRKGLIRFSRELARCPFCHVPTRNTTRGLSPRPRNLGLLSNRKTEEPVLRSPWRASTSCSDPQAMVSVFPCDHYYADRSHFAPRFYRLKLRRAPSGLDRSGWRGSRVPGNRLWVD